MILRSTQEGDWSPKMRRYWRWTLTPEEEQSRFQLLAGSNFFIHFFVGNYWAEQNIPDTQRLLSPRPVYYNSIVYYRIDDRSRCVSGLFWLAACGRLRQGRPWMTTDIDSVLSLPPVPPITDSLPPVPPFTDTTHSCHCRPLPVGHTPPPSLFTSTTRTLSWMVS